MVDSDGKINKYLPFAVLYFFFNSLLLPLGLLYTTLLTPVFILWLYKYPVFKYFYFFVALSVVFAVVHFFNGVSFAGYTKSYVLILSVFFWCMAFYQFLLNCNSLQGIFNKLIIINFFLVLLALAFYFVPFLKPILWYKNSLTAGSGNVYRLKLFTYEASYYSLLLVPLVYYYYLKILFFRTGSNMLIFCLATLPILLSFSFGVLGGIALGFVLLLVSDVKLFYIKKIKYILITGLVVLPAVFFILYYIFPNNVLFLRIGNIIGGNDTSFNGRTSDSIILAYKIARDKNLLFGCGPGQTKLIGADFFKEFYHRYFAESEVVLPNNVADILAAYGLLGVLLKLGVEFYLFFKTRVFDNYYRLGLFIFIFIYQFTGSFITNIAEYVIWILAFTAPIFPEFNKRNVFPDYYNNELIRNA
ncbi:hypothetical protein [Pinibacter soli]|uniref:O-antigen ligase family protein n=1 Tax=Pinibacter soli TaxID=3044211 RepID=A0ABT6RCG8_9BACT|nr:hypothetical protein [Pinibacter soli]MDI3320258.1 hypothetical protein [Pinibacter soli]